MKKLILLGAFCVFAFVAGVDAQLINGRSIGLNFSGGAGSEAPDPDIDTLDVGETTGVVPQTNWNNVQGASGNLTDLLLNTGTVSPVSVTFTSNNTWGRNLAVNPMNDLLSDYLDGGTGAPVNIEFSAIPFTLYDVYLYTRRNETADPNDPTPADGPGVFSDYTVNGARKDILTGNILNSFVEATPTVIGNFTKFDNVTGATLTIAANADAGNFRAPVDGVQIVERVVPEPSSIALLAAGLLGAAGWRFGRPRRP